MPSNKHVVSVRLDDQQYGTLTRFAEVVGQSRGGVVAEIVIDMLPVLERIAAAVDVARKAEQGALQGWKDSMLSKLSPMQLQAEGMRDDAMQLIHGLFETLEQAAEQKSSLRRGGPRVRGGPGADRSDGVEPPSL